MHGQKLGLELGQRLTSNVYDGIDLLCFSRACTVYRRLNARRSYKCIILSSCRKVIVFSDYLCIPLFLYLISFKNVSFYLYFQYLIKTKFHPRMLLITFVHLHYDIYLTCDLVQLGYNQSVSVVRSKLASDAFSVGKLPDFVLPGFSC